MHFVAGIVCARDAGIWASMGAFVVGLRYLRRAGVGVSSSRGGIRSSVKGTFGSIEIIDLVRKSSGVIIGAVRLDSDLAADRNALSEEVRLDLKADLRRGASMTIWASFSPLRGVWNTLKSSSSTSISWTDNG